MDRVNKLIDRADPAMVLQSAGLLPSKNKTQVTYNANALALTSSSSHGVTLQDRSKSKLGFKKGVASLSTLLPLSPYYMEHMPNLTQPTPLTIFLESILEKSNTIMSRQGDLKSKYRLAGSMAASEFWLTYKDWDRATDRKIQYFIELFGMMEWAEW